MSYLSSRRPDSQKVSQKRPVRLAAALAVISLLGGALFATPGALAAEYRIDTAHSFVQFRTQHLGFSWLIGRFNRFDGGFRYDTKSNDGPQEITLKLETASVDSNHAERDKHLRGDDFLDTDSYPHASFTSSGYSGDANGGELRGDLELHGVTRPVVITVRKIGEGKDPWGGYRVGFEGSTTITRSDFGMDYDLGPMSKQVELSLYIEGIRN